MRTNWGSATPQSSATTRQSYSNVAAVFYKPEPVVADPRELVGGERHVYHEEVVREMGDKIVMDMIESVDKDFFRIVIASDMGVDLDRAGLKFVKGPIISQWHAEDKKEKK